MVINFIRRNTSCCNIDRTKFLFITYNKNIYIKVLDIIEQSFPVHLSRFTIFSQKHRNRNIQLKKKRKTRTLPFKLKACLSL